MARMFKATVEYRDEYSHGEWRTHSVTSSDRDEAFLTAIKHCIDCERRNVKVDEIDNG